MDADNITKSLKELLVDLLIVQINNWQNALITGIAYNSKAVWPGNLFVAINGSKQNGHYYIQEAIAKGAQAIVGDEDVVNLSIPYIQVSDTRKSLAVLAKTFYDNPSQKLVNIGITGTNGKTTTTLMLDHIFEEAGYKTGLIGTVKNKVNQKVFPAHLTTPEAPDIQKLMYKMQAHECKYISMEVSSQGISCQRVDGINFDFAAVTNIGLDHTDCHPDFQHYLQTKLKFMEIIDKNKYVLLNADDTYYKNFLEHCQSKVVSFGIKNYAHVQVVECHQNSKGSFFAVKLNKPLITRGNKRLHPQIIPVFINLMGRHNVYNALIALTMALLNDIPLKFIIKSLAQFQPVTRRCELIYQKDFMIIDDTALNPHSFDAIFESLKNINYNKLVIITAIRGNRGTEINQANAAKIGFWAHKLNIPSIITTSSKSNVGPNDMVSPNEEMSFLVTLKNSSVPYCHYAELAEAIKAGLSKVNKGDLLLLLGAQGMDDGVTIALNILPGREIAIAK